jgi:hypothetical protein
MHTDRTLDEETKKRAIETAKNRLPEGAELVLLSFTGGRAFGWGGTHHDIDVHGFFAYDRDWFFKCHGMGDGFDMTLQNVYSVSEPEIRWGRWKQYYDKSNPIYTHEDFDFEKDFIDKCKPEYVENIFPYDLHLQFSRMEVDFQIRSALHTYKEMMIPLYFLREGIIETDIVNIINKHPDFQYEELNKCALKYSREDPNAEPKEAKVKKELEELYWELAEEVTSIEGTLDMKEVEGPPKPSENIPGTKNKQK